MGTIVSFVLVTLGLTALYAVGDFYKLERRIKKELRSGVLSEDRINWTRYRIVFIPSRVLWILLYVTAACVVSIWIGQFFGLLAASDDSGDSGGYGGYGFLISLIIAVLASSILENRIAEKLYAWIIPASHTAVTT